MAQTTLISDETPANPNDQIILDLYKKLVDQAGPAGADQFLQQQGANVRSADLSASQSPIVQALLGQGMTKGLSKDQYGGASETGLTYSGGVSGYGGPIRPMDKQLSGFESGTATNQAQYDNIRQAQESRLQPGPGGMTMGQLTDKLAPLMRLGPASIPAMNASGLPFKVLDPLAIKAENAGAVRPGSGWQNAVFADLVKRNGGNVEAARKEMMGVLGETSQSRAEGTAAGSPLPASAANKLNTLDASKRQMDIVMKNLDDNFLGPVRGLDSVYATRRQVGEYLNSPLGTQEEAMRGALAIAREELIRAKEGAVIPPAMYARLSRLMPLETDEPKVFRNNAKRFMTELDAAMKTVETRATAPRGRTGATQPAAQEEKQLTKAVVDEYVAKAGGDLAKAQELAKKDGYKF